MRKGAKRAEWLGIELRHLVALQTVARERSFRGAAQRLGYVQSAVSQQVAFLERTLGVRLLERASGQTPTTLTPAGEVVLAHVEEILVDLRAARTDADAVVNGLTGALRLGAFDDVADILVPKLLRCFAQRSPDVEIRVTEGRCDAGLLRQTEAGELDVTFAELPVADSRFEWREVLVEPRVLLVPAGSRLASNERSRFERTVRLVQRRGSRSARSIEAALIAHGIEPSVVREADSTAGVQALVGAGVGAAVLPQLAVDRSDDRVKVLDLDGALTPRTLGLVWRRDRMAGVRLDPLVQAASDVARSAAGASPTRFTRRRALASPAS